jgi:excinuclease UvrABC nuclease subunit
MSINITLPEPSLSMKFGDIRKNYDNLNEKGGVYLLYDVNDRLLYVGKSVNLYSRINQHITGHGKSAQFSDLIFRVDVIVERDALFREIYETYAINTLFPPYNASKLFNYKRDDKQYEIETKLDELITEREFMRQEIYKLAREFGNDVIYDIDDDLSQEEADDFAELTHLRREFRKINEKINELRKEFKG